MQPLIHLAPRPLRWLASSACRPRFCSHRPMRGRLAGKGELTKEMRFLRGASLLVAVTWLLFFASTARAQSPVTWSINANAGSSLKPGDKSTVQVTAQIQAGWHVYSLTQPAGGPNPTRITVPDGQRFKLAGAVRGPRPHVQMDADFGINTETHEGERKFQRAGCGRPQRSHGGTTARD
jgi:hypothetical protein